MKNKYVRYVFGLQLHKNVGPSCSIHDATQRYTMMHHARYSCCCICETRSGVCEMIAENKILQQTIHRRYTHKLFAKLTKNATLITQTEQVERQQEQSRWHQQQ